MRGSVDRFPNADQRLRRLIDRLREQLSRNQTRVLDYSVNQAGNTAGVSTVLYSSLVPAGLLSRNGDSLRLDASFILNGGGAGTQLRFYLGPLGVYTSGTIMYDTGSLPVSSAQSAVFSFLIIRYGISTSVFSLIVGSTFSTLKGASSFGSSAQNTQSNLYLTAIGDGANANDAKGFLWQTTYIPTSTPGG